MRLKHIKLVGFKSFVDPTKVPFPDQMTCVVGPNGCGKSNVIDAVRWVLGESSAKNLRGDAMSDVIFNGSASRKPVSQASVELVFDNESGRIQGEYAAFKEISVKRQVTRDGQSNYFLNNSKCRRRDITDLFLGTGLGPRSYAIIEQGMISRLIESKPQELRVFIEEAAGISKYKERRRETESRIKHTRENLERIADVREELGQQLEKLQRQASAAQRYKELKAQERQLKGELYALRWQQLEQKRQQLQTELEQQKTELERWQAEQTGDERGVIERRELAQQLKQTVDDHQQQLFKVSNRVTRLEQSIQHQQQLTEQRKLRHQQLQQELEELQQQGEEDNQQQQQLEQQQQELEPQAEQLEEQLLLVEDQLQDAEEHWQQFQQQQAEYQQQQRHVQQQLQQTELQHQRLQQQLTYLQEQQQQLIEQQSELDLAAAKSEQQQHQQLLQQCEDKVAEAEQQQQQHRSQLLQLKQQFEQARQQQLECQRQSQQQQTRLQTLQQLLQHQQAELSPVADDWLERQAAQPLREVLKVDPQWQRALEKVLRPWLDSYWLSQSVTADEVPEGISVLWAQDSGPEPDQNTAAAVVSGRARQWSLLRYCLLADSLEQAPRLLAESPQALLVLTKEGHWCTAQSLAVDGLSDGDSILEIQQQVRELEQQLVPLKSDYDDACKKVTVAEQALEQAENEQQQLQQTLQLQQTELAKQQQRHSYSQQHYQQRQQQQQKIAEQQQQLEQQQAQAEEQLEQLQQQQDEWQQRLDQLPEQQPEQQAELEQQLRQVQQQQQQLSSRQQQVQLERQHLQTQRQQLKKLNERHQQRIQALQDELQTVSEQKLTEQQESDREQLQQLLEQRELASEQLQQQREQLAEVENELHELSQGSSALREKIAQIQQQMQSTEIELAKLQERTQAALESLAETRLSLKQLLQEIDEQADEKRWEQQLERVQSQVKRLGAINLAAIDEAETQKQRKDYLDQQYDDLFSALETLEEAIRKIDKETRQRFKTTFEAVNRDLQLLFPKVFGGGSAQLQLTDDDLLETGVAIMAQPPGKKNSTIHLLSGGEKALTALSLVFAIFRLNPAPFCLLDEVDAPLDDANVGRFCRLVNEMSESVQFIYISHNKVAMEMASHLAGVTMQEAGVSRLVAVDVEQAVAMTEGE
ncbi:MAG: chromosome segregation protein SMC [Pseudomonadota bacterium]